VAVRALLLAAGWIVLLAGVFIWLATTEPGRLREHLRLSQFWFLEVQFVLLVGLTIVNIPGCVRRLRLSARDCAAAASAAALAIVLAGMVAPQTNRIYYDEQIYQGVAQNLGDLRLAQMCNDGTVEYGHLQCRAAEYNKQPYGYPYVLSVVYRLFGVSYWLAPRVNVLSAAALVVVVFLLAGTLFEDVRVARLAALVCALMPEQLRWSHTAAAEPAAAAVGALAALAAVHFVRTRSGQALAWTIVATVFAAQFRTESLLIALVTVAAIALWAPAEFRRRRFWEWALAGAMLASGLAAHLFAVRGEGWGAAGDRMSLDFVAGNLQTNAAFYLGDARFPVVYTVLALTALAAWRDRRATGIALLYFCAFAGVYLSFYAGSYDYGADVRYALMTFPPIALLAGAGSALLVRIVHRTGLDLRSAELLVVAVLAFQFLGYLPWVRAVGEEAWAARADIRFAERFAPRLPFNSIVLTHNPGVFHVMGHNAAQLSIASANPEYVTHELMRRYAGGVFLHWNFWCNVDDPVQREFCVLGLARFRHTLVEEYRERDYRYAFYRLERAGEVTVPAGGDAHAAP
jgi:hypothetical protein